MLDAALAVARGYGYEVVFPTQEQVAVLARAAVGRLSTSARCGRCSNWRSREMKATSSVRQIGGSRPLHTSAAGALTAAPGVPA
jgi:hypothetical protein